MISEMPRLNKIQISPRPSGARERLTSRSGRGAEAIQLYGWDSRSATWHGPNELSGCEVPNKRMLEALRAAPARSWYGPVSCCSPGEPAARFFTLVHDLSDCVVALIYCNESKAGPAEILAVVPSERRSPLREDFAFEFLAFARFLGSLGAEAELQVHEAIASAIAGRSDSSTCVFSISSGLWPSDLDPVLSRCVEKLAVTLCQWVDESYPAVRHPRRNSITAA